LIHIDSTLPDGIAFIKLKINLYNVFYINGIRYFKKSGSVVLQDESSSVWRVLSKNGELKLKI